MILIKRLFIFATAMPDIILTEKAIAILSKAEKLFAAKGFDGASVRDIAKACGINVAMVSYYFGSKEKMLERLFHLRMKEGRDASREVSARTDIDARQKLEIIIKNFVTRVSGSPSFYMIMLTAQLNIHNKRIMALVNENRNEHLNTIREILNQGIAEKRFRKDVDAVFLQATISGIIFYALQAKIIFKERKEKTDSWTWQQLEDYLLDACHKLTEHEH